MIKYECHATSAATTACSEDPVESYRAPDPAAHRPLGTVPGTRSSASRDPRVEVAALASPPLAVETPARRADALARALCAARERITLPLAQLAASLCRESAWCAFGFARASDFALEYLDRSGRWLRDLAALHSALAALPGLDAALTGDDGGPPLGRVRALLIGRVAGTGTLAAWIALARRLTVRALREAVASARRAAVDADDPAVARDPEASRASNAAPGDPVPDAGHHTTLATIDDDDADDDLVLLRISAPSALIAAFDEAVDLHRAVEGSETTIASFVESLVAEAWAGDPVAADPLAAERAVPGAPSSDIDRAGIRQGPRPSVVEEALARSTDGCRHLPDKNDASWGLSLGRSTLRRLAALARDGDRGSPADRVSRMRGLLSIETEIEVRLGRLLATMGEDRAWTRLRFAGVGHYAEERLGLSRTAAQSRARAAHLLGRFPRVREAYEAGALGLEAALVIGRVLSSPAAGGASAAGGVPAEHAWVRHAREVTVKRLRDEARAIARAGAFRSIGTIQSAGTPFADRQAGPVAASPLSDDSWHASLSRAPGTARRRIGVLGLLAIGARPAGPAGDRSAAPTLDGEDHDRLAGSFSPTTAVISKPDVFLRLTLPYDLADRFVAAVEGARARCAREAEGIAWHDEDAVGDLPSGGHFSDVGHLPGARLAARVFAIACRPVPAWVGLLALLEDFVETWDPLEHADDLPDNPIYARDGWRCSAPACSSRRNLEDHHVHYRSHLGSNGQHNRVCLCRFHHKRGQHGGLASCRGTAPLALTWRLGKREVGRWYRNERRLPGDPGVPGQSEAAGVQK